MIEKLDERSRKYYHLAIDTLVKRSIAPEDLLCWQRCENLIDRDVNALMRKALESVIGIPAPVIDEERATDQQYIIEYLYRSREYVNYLLAQAQQAGMAEHVEAVQYD